MNGFTFIINIETEKIHDILLFLRRVKTLESAERYGSSLRGNKNTVVKTLMATGAHGSVIGTECKVRVDINHAVALALLHDQGS